MIPKKPALGLDPRVRTGFRKRLCSVEYLERDSDSKKRYPALARCTGCTAADQHREPEWIADRLRADRDWSSPPTNDLALEVVDGHAGPVAARTRKRFGVTVIGNVSGFGLGQMGRRHTRWLFPDNRDFYKFINGPAGKADGWNSHPCGSRSESAVHDFHQKSPRKSP